MALNASHKQIYDTHSLWSHLGVGTLQQKLSLLAAGAKTLWKGTDAPTGLDRLHYTTTWGSAIYKANREGLNWKMAQPIEGSTIWVDYWVMTYALKGNLLKQKIALEWINFNISPEIQSHLSQQWGTSMVTHYPNKALSHKEKSNAVLNIDPKVTNNSLWEITSVRLNI